MRIELNGTDTDIPPGTTIAGLVALRKLSPDKVAVEVNKRLVRSAQYDRVLVEGDRVEIVTFVGGG